MRFIAIIGLWQVLALSATAAHIGVNVRFKAVVGDQEAVCGRTYRGVGVTAASIRLKDLRFYIHNLRLLDNRGQAVDGITGYSCQSTLAGSIPDARRAGVKVASIVTARTAGTNSAYLVTAPAEEALHLTVLFPSERLHRVHGRRSPGGDVAGGEGRDQ